MPVGKGAGGMRVLGERRRTSNGGGNQSWRGWLNRKLCRRGSCNGIGTGMISRDSTIAGWSSHSRRGNRTGRCSRDRGCCRRQGTPTHGSMKMGKVKAIPNGKSCQMISIERAMYDRSG